MITANSVAYVPWWTSARGWLLILPLLAFGIGLCSTIIYKVKYKEANALYLYYRVLLIADKEIAPFVENLQRYADNSAAESIDRSELLARLERCLQQMAELIEEVEGNVPAPRVKIEVQLRTLADYLLKLRPLLMQPSVDAEAYRSILQALAQHQEQLWSASHSLGAGESAERGIIVALSHSKEWLISAALFSGLALLVLYIRQWRHVLRTHEHLVRESRQLNQDKQTLSYQASHDALTGLLNRAEFERRFERLFAHVQAGEQSSGALLCLDLDRFKAVNDRCGHLAGDQLLRQVAEVLSQRLRKHDTLARLGGDEFAVLLEECSPTEALWVAQALQDAVHALYFTWQDETFRLSVSIGVAAIEPDSESTTAVLIAADQACYRAKQNSHNPTRIPLSGSAGLNDEPSTTPDSCLSADQTQTQQQPEP